MVRIRSRTFSAAARPFGGSGSSQVLLEQGELQPQVVRQCCGGLLDQGPCPVLGTRPVVGVDQHGEETPGITTCLDRVLRLVGRLGLLEQILGLLLEAVEGFAGVVALRIRLQQRRPVSRLRGEQLDLPT